MKKILAIIIALITVTAFIAAGCSETKDSTNSEKDSSAVSAASEETEAETTSPALETKALLTEKKWNCQKGYQGGEEVNIQSYYGSIVKETGAYIEFSDDNTFKCIMGFSGCEGTYEISDDGQVTVTKTILYSGDKESKINETEKLEVEGDFDTISINLEGVKLIFN